jgi:hypothetical protein
MPDDAALWLLREQQFFTNWDDFVSPERVAQSEAAVLRLVETGPNWVLFLKSRPRILNPAQRNGFRPHDFGSKMPLGQPGRTTVSTRFGPLSLQAALEEPELRLLRATALVEYHVRRNEVARKSHAKTWRAKHPDVSFLRL